MESDGVDAISICAREGYEDRLGGGLTAGPSFSGSGTCPREMPKSPSLGARVHNRCANIVEVTMPREPSHQGQGVEAGIGQLSSMQGTPLERPDVVAVP